MDIVEQQHWLVLSRLPGCSAAIRRRLQLQMSGPLEILHAPAAVWTAAGAGPELLGQLSAWQRRPHVHAAQQQALRDLDCLQQQAASLCVLGTPPYPPLLAEIHDPPPLLYVSGNEDCLREPSMALVGSRRPASSGCRAAREFAAALVDAGLIISSGMALGIDAEAHRAALAAGGETIAVMATGIEIRYPRRHQDLASEIQRRGALVTEFPPGSQPRREHFPQRNRLISGLSLGVLVVEAALRSGSLITARMAMEQNREVFTLPHSIYYAGGRGCNHLLKQGAKLVETPIDIFEELGPLYTAQQEFQQAENTPIPDIGAVGQIYEAVGYEGISVDELGLRQEMDAAEVLSALVELQVRGLLECRNGLYMRK
jgi:DNA processing protein